MERLDGEMSSTDREQILTKCKEILDLNVHLSNQQVKLFITDLSNFTLAPWSMPNFTSNATGQE